MPHTPLDRLANAEAAAALHAAVCDSLAKLELEADAGARRDAAQRVARRARAAAARLIALNPALPKLPSALRDPETDLVYVLFGWSKHAAAVDAEAAHKRDGDAERDEWNRLTDLQRDILKLLLQRGAFSADGRLMGDDIERETGATHADVNRECAALKLAELIESNRNRRGGRWLSRAGLALVQSRGRNATKSACA